MWPRVRPWAGRRKTAYQIMDGEVKWKTLRRAAHDCYWPISNVTDLADWWESLVLFEDTLNAWGIMEEAIK